MKGIKTMTSYNLPNNILQTVTTFQRGGMAYLQNYGCFIGELTNKKFKDFQKIQDNLGSTISWDLPPKAIAVNGLQAVFQGMTQRPATLSVTQSSNASFAFNATQLIYNVGKDADPYREVFGKSALAALGNKIETNLALHCASAAVYGTENPNITPGTPIYKSGPYRFGLNGVTPLTSYQQLQQMMSDFVEPGAVTGDFRIVLPNTITPPIIGTGLNQFAPRRNDEIAMSWELGEFGSPQAKYYISNLLPTHISGNVGNAAAGGNVLTVVSTNDPTGTSITQITFSGASATDPDAIKAGDRFQFIPVSGTPGPRITTFFGDHVTNQPVQFRAIADAASNGGGQVTVNIYPALSVNALGNFAQDTEWMDKNVVAGMKALVPPSHRVGVILSDNCFFMAMPLLPPQPPFDTSSSVMDDTTGASLRLTIGSQYGGNLYGWIYDAVWDALMVPEYCYAILLPL